MANQASQESIKAKILMYPRTLILIALRLKLVLSSVILMDKPRDDEESWDSVGDLDEVLGPEESGGEDWGHADAHECRANLEMRSN